MSKPILGAYVTVLHTLQVNAKCGYSGRVIGIETLYPGDRYAVNSYSATGLTVRLKGVRVSSTLRWNEVKVLQSARVHTGIMAMSGDLFG